MNFRAFAEVSILIFVGGVIVGRITMSWQIGRRFILTPKHSFKGGSWKPDR